MKPRTVHLAVRQFSEIIYEAETVQPLQIKS
jgi:hypothetical protein